MAFAASLLYFTSSFYIGNTHITPVQGGTAREAVLGYPAAINPVAASANEVDRTLLHLLYAGLFTYDENGNLAPDIVKEYEIKEDGRIFELTLHDNLRWSDGTPLTVEDIIFTIEAIQNPENQSPDRRNWIGVTIDPISDTTFHLELREPYYPFLERLTLKPMPKHIWEEKQAEDFTWPAQFNIQPIGNGPYVVRNITEDTDIGRVTEMKLERNPHYHKHGLPYISSFELSFFGSIEAYADAVQRGRTDSFTLSHLTIESIPSNRTVYTFPIPGYIAVFFNLGHPDASGAFGEKDIRHALRAALNKEQLVEDIFGNEMEAIETPLPSSVSDSSTSQRRAHFSIDHALSLFEAQGLVRRDGRIGKIPAPSTPHQRLSADLRQGSQGQQVRMLQECLARDSSIYPQGTVSGTFGQQTTSAVIAFQEQYREEILEPHGLERGTGAVGGATREKLNEICFPEPEEEFEQFTITLTVPDESPLRETAEHIRDQWETIGVSVELSLHTPQELQRTIIPDRSYQALLFGQTLGIIPDPLAFWHSSQMRHPGFNISSYENAEVDRLLGEFRRAAGDEDRKTKAEQLQRLILEDAPAIFLYAPHYRYAAHRRIQGIQERMLLAGSQRFSGVEKWYINTKRVWKQP